MPTDTNNGFNNPLEAEKSLTSAFNPQNERQREAIKRAAALIPDRTPSPTETPAQTVDQEPTVADIFSGLQMPTARPEQEQFDADYRSFLESQTAPIDEAKIREQSLAQMQAQIDATNKMYAQELARAQEQGRGRLGTTTAISARRGLLGSDFGQAQQQKTEDFNTQIEQSIEQERLARIAGLMSDAQSNAEAQIRERRNAMLQGFEARKAYYAGQEERRAANTQNAIQSLIAQDVDIDDLTQAQLGQYARSYGVNVQDIVSGYNTQRDAMEAQQMQAEAQAIREQLENQKIMAQIAEIEADIQSGRLLELSEGQMIYDTVTGETFKNPKTFAPSTRRTGGIGGTGTGVSGAGVAGAEPEYGTPDYFKNVISSSVGGKDLTQSESENIMQMQRAFAGVDSLVNQLAMGEIDNKTSKEVFGQRTGKVRGRLSNLKQQLVGDADVASIKATIQGLIPTVARGIFGEVGVLTDADIANYKKTLPSLVNTGRENEAVTLIMLDVLNKSYGNALETYALSGRDVSGFLPQYESFRSRLEGLQTQLGGGQTQETQTPQTLEELYSVSDDAQTQVIENLLEQGYSDADVIEYMQLAQ